MTTHQPTIPVFYDARMACEPEGFSPSPAKPRKAVESWQRLDLPIRIEAVRPLTREEIAVAHDRGFVDGVLDLRTVNGHGTCSPKLAATLPFTTGAMVATGRSAWKSGGPAAAPVSGFHHAGWSSGGGFFTFNGLAIAAVLLHGEGCGRVGILDCDQHRGDGTEDIVRRLGLNWVRHCTADRDYERAAESFLHDLPAMTEGFRGCDVLLYQAGADPHVHDPLGGWLTTEQLRRRDAIVFETCKRIGLGVAWDLAGGYQEPGSDGRWPVLEVHDNTMRECARVYCSEEDQ